ncbi:MAG TPA: YggS family pyridoxal phosphate-dependent enzyme [Dehalococcoidia bacterium]|nr:YggS family pyridoxal phosphate-dependent enzyme [Dehalococcoidia bacterium]
MQVYTIAQRAEGIRRRIAEACEKAGRPPEDVTIVAVSKTFPPSAIREAFLAGFQHIGENRVQEAEEKVPELRDLDIVWHMVGHLQSNKVKKALDIFNIIQSVDSLHLAEEISRRAQKTIPVLLEVNIGQEESKFGLTPEVALRESGRFANLPHLELRGLMTVAPICQDPEEVRPIFRRLRELRDTLGLRELSMGMTDDFPVAIEEGATIVRIGRAIFGERTI